MKKLNFTLKSTLISVILLSVLSTHSMENDKQLALQAKQYNNHNYLLQNTKLNKIFSFCLSNKKDQVKSLEESIKNFMKISMTCTRLNKLLKHEKIGKLCKGYTNTDKDLTLKHLIKNIKFNAQISTKYSPVLSILICAGANPNKGETPAFFFAASLNMAGLCLYHGANVNETDSSDLNVLWHITNDDLYSSDIINFYLDHYANPRTSHPSNFSCLLHQSNISLEKMRILLTQYIPYMINHLNKKGKTPLDANMTLLKKYSYKAIILLNDNYSDLLSVLPHDVRKYIVQYMMMDSRFILINERIKLLRSYGAKTAYQEYLSFFGYDSTRIKNMK